jgi:hypothetical protein
MRVTKILMLATDVGFILYWLATALAWFPPDVLFKDYHDPLVVAWNWSFLPLDLLVSATGLGGLWLGTRRRTKGRQALPDAAIGRMLMTVSLSLTVCSGLMAIAYWANRGDFDPLWWGFNGFLLLYPLPGLFILILKTGASGTAATEAGPARHQ